MRISDTETTGKTGRRLRDVASIVGLLSAIGGFLWLAWHDGLTPWQITVWGLGIAILSEVRNVEADLRERQ